VAEYKRHTAADQKVKSADEGGITFAVPFSAGEAINAACNEWMSVLISPVNAAVKRRAVRLIV
jgi:hypothetical protein